MKDFTRKLTSFLIFLTFAAGVFNISYAAGYQLDNSGFEAWGNSFNGAPALSAPWNEANVHKTVAGINVYGQVVFQSTDAHTGSYSVRCQDTEVGAAGITEVSPSWITLGSPWAYLDGLDVGSATAGTDGGIAFSARPDTMALWVKRSSAGDENFNLVYYSWRGTSYGSYYKNKDGDCSNTSHYDEESDIRLTTDGNKCSGQPSTKATQVSEGWFKTKSQYASWTQIKVPIKYYNDQIPEKMNIIISASNYPNFRATTGLYTSSCLIFDDISLIYGSCVHELLINGEAYGLFKSNVYEYTYDLEPGMLIPSIKCRRSGRTLSGSEISIVNGTKGGAPTTITVKAEDGSSTTTYKIYFVAARDTNPYPLNIKVDGVSLPDFDAKKSNYVVTLPYGTTENPVIDVVKAKEGQSVKIDPFTVPGVAKITVYAENPTYQSTYNITFKSGELDDTTLEDIQVNGVSIDGYSPTATVYKVNLPVGTTSNPVITYTSAYPEGSQTVEIRQHGLNDVDSVIVSAPGAKIDRVYKITYNITESTYSYLKDLKVSGETISGFAPNKLRYTYTLPTGTTVLPEVSYTSGDDFQTVTKIDGSVDGTTEIKVQAQDKIHTSIYRIDFPLTKSSNSRLKDIKVDNVSLEDFAPEKTSYTYKLPTGTTELPDITWTKGDENQTVNAVYGGVNGTTKITVTAEDESVTTYSIKFSAEQATNTLLDDIKLDGVSMENFIPDVKFYEISLPHGTKTLPLIEPVAHDTLQTVTTNLGDVNSETRITVKAQSGDYSVYTLSFSVEKSANASLSDISVAGETIDGFAPDKLEYSYILAPGTTVLPAIAYTKGDEYQKVLMAKGGINGTTTITVTAENGNERQYSIAFSVEKSANANLKNIFIGGTPLDGFNPEQYSYNYSLPVGAVTSPVITVDKEATQTVTITKPQLYGTAYINVVPEDGANNVYTVKFVTSEGGDCSLADIKVGGVTIEGFRPDSTTYSIELPQGTKTLPEIAYTKGDDNQNVELTEGGLDGLTTINVMSENGSTRVYTIDFTLLRSSDGTLSDIKVDGISIAGFRPDSLEYTFIMEKGRSDRPVVTPVKSNAEARVSAVMPYIDGDVKFYVTSEDGIEKSLYKVHLVYAKDTSTVLAGISVNGTPVSLVESQYDYNVSDSFDRTPTVQYTRRDSSQIVILNTTLSEATLDVIAEDGSEAQYKLTFNYVPSSNALLSDLQLYDSDSLRFISIADFASDKFDYEVTLPKTQSDVYTINCVGKEKGQTYKISYASLNQKTLIDVTAADSVTTQRYSVTFNVEKSSVCTLSSIAIDGDTINGFHPDSTNYEFIIDEDVTARGVLSYTKSDAYSTVQVTDDVFSKASYITVTAEDGTEKTYTLNFKTDFAGSENVLAGIDIDGFALAGFDPHTFEYTIPETTGGALPVIAYTKNYYAQSVFMAFSGRNDVKITVKSNQDGVEDAVYTLKYATSEKYNYLSGIKVNGSVIEGFDPAKLKYVVQVADQPSSVDAVGTADKTVSTIAHTQFVTPADGSKQSVTYDVYFHYIGDDIPNKNMENWSKTQYSTGGTHYKPTSWTALADVKNGKYGGTAYCGDELTKAGDGSAHFTTEYWAVLHSGVPAVMTLGNLSLSWGVAGNTSVSFSGDGIDFRNTPDNAVMNYKLPTKVGNGALISFIFNDGASFKFDNVEKSESSSYADHWLALETDGHDVSKLNIIVNATNQTSYPSPQSMFNDGVDFYLKSMRFVYSSAIKSIKVNGTEVAMDGTSGTVTIDKEYMGLPEFDITGEVSDQTYDIDYGTEVSGIRTVSIRSYAEDMTYTDYTVEVEREVVTSALSSIKVAGLEVEEFSGLNFDYYVTLPQGNHFMPDVVAYGSSNRINTSMSVDGNVVTIKSKSDVDDEYTYTVTFTGDEISSADLKSLSVKDQEIGFNPATENYDIKLVARTTELPAISFEKLSDKQKVVLTEGGVNGNTTLTVTSADGTKEKTYTLAFTVSDKSNTTSKLSSMSVVDAESQIPFEPDIMQYEYAKEIDSMAVINYSRAFREDSMTVTVNNDSVVWNLHNLVSSTQNEYKLKFNNQLSNDSLLAGVILNGDTVKDFIPGQKEYEFSVERNKPIALDVILSNAGQSVETNFDSTTYIVKVTAANGVDYSKYRFDIDMKAGSEADLDSIEVDGVAIEDFSPEKTDYKVQLPEGSVITPEIYGYCGSEGASATMLVNTLSETSQIDVASEEGSSKQTYFVSFEVKKSDDAKLKLISSDYVALPDFDADKFDYTISVEVGDEDPVITYKKGYEGQSVTSTPTAEGVNLEVVSESDTVKNTYVITFDRLKATGSKLSVIYLDGDTIKGFHPDTLEYDVELPVGTSTLPSIAVETGDYGQNVEITTNGVRGDAVIVVTSQDLQSVNTYIIHFSVAKSDNSYLNMILYDGDTQIDGFAPETFDYNVELAVGRTDIPEVTWEAGEEHQSVEKSVDSTTVTLLVTAENGDASTYKVNFVITLSKADSLKMIIVDGNDIEEFKPNEYTYYVTVPLETPDINKVPVDYRQFEDCAAWQTIDTLRFDGGVTFTVTAQDTMYKKSYTVNIEREKSTYTKLKMLYTDNKPIDDFDAEVYDYDIILPIGTRVIPKVTWDKGDIYQRVDSLVSTDSLLWQIKVWAQNGDSSLYTVNFTVELSHNANLKSITLGDERQLIPSFDEGHYDYSVILPYGTTEVPLITFEKGDEWQSVETLFTEDVNGTSTIKVTAEDGIIVNTYTIKFSVAPSDVNTLDEITYNEVLIDGFNPFTTNYTVTLPYGTTELGKVSYVLTEPENEKADSTIKRTETGWQVDINVTALDGTPNAYTVSFVIAGDTENRLADIKAYGKTISGFDKDVDVYEYELEPYSSKSLLPDSASISYTKLSDNETVVVKLDSLSSRYSKITVTVTPEEGDPRVYEITTVIPLSTNDNLESIKICGLELEDYDPEIREYTYKIKFGSEVVDTTIYKITYSQYKEEIGNQLVKVSQSDENKMDYSIYVYSQSYMAGEDLKAKDVYLIHFVVDDFDPSQEPTADMVCISSMPDGGWKFTSKCDNVTVVLTTLSGQFMAIIDIPAVEPNFSTICDINATGYVYYGAAKNQIVAYNFIHMKKKKISAGKFKGF